LANEHYKFKLYNDNSFRSREDTGDLMMREVDFEAEEFEQRVCFFNNGYDVRRVK
jgi:hypothetical protein